MRSNIWGHFQICITVPLITYLFHFSAYLFNWIKEHPLKEYWCKLKIDKIIYSKSQSRTKYDDSKKKAFNESFKRWLHVPEVVPRVFHFTPLQVYFTSPSLRVKSQFCNLKHDKRKRFFSTHISPFKGLYPPNFFKKVTFDFLMFLVL